MKIQKLKIIYEAKSMIKLLKKIHFALIVGVLGTATSIQILAQPKCSPVTDYTLGMTLSGGGDNWAGIYRNGPSPVNTGVIAVTAENKKVAENVLKNSAPTSQVSGNATKIYNNNGSWFWACSSKYGNYTLPENVVGINFYSPDYNKEGNVVPKDKQTSREEKVNKINSSGGNSY